MMRALLLGFPLFFLLCHGAIAETPFGFAGDPNKCFVAVGLEPTDSNILRVVGLGRSVTRDCDVTPAMMEEALKSAFDRLASEGQEAKPKLIFLGRFYDYPWLSQGLTAWAANDPDWDGKNGRPARENVSENDVVGDIVSLMVMEPLTPSAKASPDARIGLSFLPALLNRYGYRFERASVEKVMSGYDGKLFAPSDMPNAKLLPFDALVHLRIAKTP